MSIVRSSAKYSGVIFLPTMLYEMHLYCWRRWAKHLIIMLWCLFLQIQLSSGCYGTCTLWLVWRMFWVFMLMSEWFFSSIMCDFFMYCSVGGSHSNTSWKMKSSCNRLIFIQSEHLHLVRQLLVMFCSEFKKKMQFNHKSSLIDMDYAAGKM